MTGPSFNAGEDGPGRGPARPRLIKSGAVVTGGSRRCCVREVSQRRGVGGGGWAADGMRSKRPDEPRLFGGFERLPGACRKLIAQHTAGCLKDGAFDELGVWKHASGTSCWERALGGQQRLPSLTFDSDVLAAVAHTWTGGGICSVIALFLTEEEKTSLRSRFTF